MAVSQQVEQAVSGGIAARSRNMELEQEEHEEHEEQEEQEEQEELTRSIKASRCIRIVRALVDQRRAMGQKPELQRTAQLV